jgi:glutamate-1-semialdehyde aminotransferase
LDGYEADLQALEHGVNKIIPPQLDTAGLMWGRLNLLDRGEPSRMATNSGTAIGLPLTMISGVFAQTYVETADDLINNARDYHGALETFRETLRQVLESYRHQELRQEERFGAILRDI